MKRSYPDRRRLEYQCISAIAFVRNDANILECPCWIMLINVVAMDMLKSKMPPGINLEYCIFLSYNVFNNLSDIRIVDNKY